MRPTEVTLPGAQPVLTSWYHRARWTQGKEAGSGLPEVASAVASLSESMKRSLMGTTLPLKEARQAR